MVHYFKSIAPGFPGAKRTTLPTNLNDDLTEMYTPQPHLIDHGYTKKHKFCSLEDLEELREIALDRKAWRNFINKVTSVCPVTETGDVDSSVEES